MTRHQMSEYDLDLDDENSDFELQNDKNDHESDEGMFIVQWIICYL